MNGMPAEQFQRLENALSTLRQLTEQKIQATVARDHGALVALLQDELDPLQQVQQTLWAYPAFSDAQRQTLEPLLVAWNERVAYLGELLQTQLGYIDFARELLGTVVPESVLDQQW